MQSLASQYGGWVLAAVATIPHILSLFNKESRKMKREEHDTAKDVIALLSTKVAVLEKNDKEKDKSIEELNRKLDILTTENRTLRDVLQGRDSETKKFQSDVYATIDVVKKDSYAAIEIIKHNDKVSEENSKTLQKIATLLEAVVKMQHAIQ